MAQTFDENKANKEMDRYSRAIAALGVEVMKNLGSLDVLVLGLNGVGIESAKNLCLAGPRGVTVWDDEITKVADLGTNFYLNQGHVDSKTKRSIACIGMLSELNPYVSVQVHEGDITNIDFLSKFGVVVVAKHLPKSTLIKINEICRSHKGSTGANEPIPFIMASTFGVTFSVFSDFGDKHMITDSDGLTVDSMVIENIDEFGVVTVGADRHGLDDGDHVKISDVEGATFLNNLEKIKVKRIYHKRPDIDNNGNVKVDSKGNPRYRSVQILNQFQIDLPDMKDLKNYTNGGIVDYVKPQYILPFRSLNESLTNPCIDEFQAMMNQVYHIDEGRQSDGTSSQLHFSLLALFDFEEKYNRLPELHNYDDAKEMITIANQILNKHKEIGEGKALIIDEINDDIVTKYSLYAKAELPGCCAFLGGVVAQEVVKKFGKYTPLHQWVVGDYFELLPYGTAVPPNAAAQGCRYDHQISIFGNDVQDKISKSKVFLIGVGALGCEYMKGLALMGVGTHKEGTVYITDMDRIELSNLSRQFLFRQKHVGKPKSVSAASVAKDMNPSMNLVCHETKVSPETENIFTDEFWDSLDVVWNALDNIDARLYADSKCLIHSKPLLESGTEGCLCNSSIHLPHQTPSYGDTPVQETGKIAACTLRNFPHLIVHCIEWARPRFECLFEFEAKSLNSVVSDINTFFTQTDKEPASEQVKIFEKTIILLEASKKRTFETCVNLAFKEFTDQFRNRIKDLTYSFPADARMTRKVEDTGEILDLGAFWSGKKRFPQFAELDLTDELQVSFLFSAANLYAYMLGVEHVRDINTFINIITNMKLQHEEWHAPSDKVDISDDGKKEEKENNSASSIDKDDDIKKVEQLKKNIVTLMSETEFQAVYVADFEKDDDSNFHIDFITACSNMRAWNYKIKPATRLKAKVIAGKIIAALASTTAMITGLTELEFYKIIMGFKKVKEDKEAKIKEYNPFFNANCNLAIAKFDLFATKEPEGKKSQFDEIMQCDVAAVPEGWTSWDYVVFNKGDVTIEQFIEDFPSVHYGVTVDDISKSTFTDEEIKANKGGYMYESYAYDAETQGIYAGRKKRKLREVYEEVYGDIPENRKFILLGGNFAQDGEGVNIPPVKFVFG